MSNIRTPSFDQLRVLAAAAESGSFSAAARRLGRTQPVVSYIISSLESQTGLTLFDRGGRRPILTEDGAALLTYARRLCLMADEMHAHLQNLRQGLEAQICLAIDALLPLGGVSRTLHDFEAAFPSITLKVETETLGGVLALVRDGVAHVGLTGILIEWPDEIEAVSIGSMTIVPVAAPGHSLASSNECPTVAAMRDNLQLALSDRSGTTDGHPMAVHSSRTWKFTDPAMKLAVLRSGIGWAHMPLHLVQNDLDRGSLVQLALPIMPGGDMPCTLLRRRDLALSRASRYLIDELTANGLGSRETEA